MLLSAGTDFCRRLCGRRTLNRLSISRNTVPRGAPGPCSITIRGPTGGHASLARKPMKMRASEPARVFSALLLGASVCYSRQACADYEPNKYVEPETNQVLEYNLYVPSSLAPGSRY